MISTRLFFEDAYEQVSDEIANGLLDKIKDEQGRIGFYDLPTASGETLDKIYKFIISNNAVYKGKIKNLVVLGIGGSSLGTKAVDNALKHSGKRNCSRILPT